MNDVLGDELVNASIGASFVKYVIESVRRGKEMSVVDLVKRYAVIFHLPEGSNGGGGVFKHRRTEANDDADPLHFAATFLSDSVLQQILI